MIKGLIIKKTDGTEVFNSGNKTSKDAIRGIHTITLSPSQNNLTTIPHNFGYFPSYKAYIKESTGTWIPVIRSLQMTLRPSSDTVADVWIDGTNLNIFTLNFGSSSKEIKVKYFIFKNQTI